MTKKTEYISLPPQKFIWMAVIGAVFYWFIDSLIDVVFFANDSYLDSFFTSGMDLYMRITVVVLMLGFGFMTSKYVEANNRLNSYITEELRQNNKYYQELYGHPTLAIVILNEYAEIVDWSVGAERLLGWRKNELIGQNLFDSKLRPKHLTDTDPFDFLISQPIEVAVKCLTADGLTVNCDWRHAVIKNEHGMVNVMSVAHPSFTN